jgi:hypothetical protein
MSKEMGMIYLEAMDNFEPPVLGLGENSFIEFGYTENDKEAYKLDLDRPELVKDKKLKIVVPMNSVKKGEYAWFRFN